MTAVARLGFDLGGTKIAAAILDAQGRTLHESRAPTPRHDYAGTLAALAAMLRTAEAETGLRVSVGIGIPGSLNPATGLVQNANSTWLNGRPFARDLADALGRPLRAANDANCFALSEAADGAGAGLPSLFGVILGTGCGGGFVTHARIHDGPLGIGGEWGHNPLPWPEPDEYPGPRCWCGRHGCMETWVSGPALARDYAARGGDPARSARDIAALAEVDGIAHAALEAHLLRLARGLAMVVNILDPHALVLGGGLSGMAHLYGRLPQAMAPFLFCDTPGIRVLPPAHGAASGVRGAARLWSESEAEAMFA